MAQTKTILILSLFVAVAAAGAFLIDRAFVLPVAFGSVMLCLFFYLIFDEVILLFLNAKEDKNPQLVEFVNRLAPLHIFMYANNQPNVFAVSKTKLVVSTGLRNILTKSELEGIIARELFFIKNNEVGLALFFTITSWQHEFEADAFAANFTRDPETLISAITKVGKKNSFCPPIEERVKLLRAM